MKPIILGFSLSVNVILSFFPINKTKTPIIFVVLIKEFGTAGCHFYGIVNMFQAFQISSIDKHSLSSVRFGNPLYSFDYMFIIWGKDKFTPSYSPDAFYIDSLIQKMFLKPFKISWKIALPRGYYPQSLQNVFHNIISLNRLLGEYF